MHKFRFSFDQRGDRQIAHDTRLCRWAFLSYLFNHVADLQGWWCVIAAYWVTLHLNATISKYKPVSLDVPLLMTKICNGISEDLLFI
jgi:hypothetical protein